MGIAVRPISLFITGRLLLNDAMPSVAEQLRAAREARQITVNQVAETTKIRTDHIRALEEGNYNLFVAPVYIRGFIRTYATLLKLDVAKLMTEVEGELNRTEKFREPPAFTGPPKGALDFVMLQLSKLNLRKGVAVLGALVLLGAVLFGYWVWKQVQTRDPLKNLPAAEFRSGNSNRQDKLPLPAPVPRR